MKLQQLHIYQHRHFQDRSFSFSSGINLIQGPNEAGKTSLHKFLLYLLFGPEKKGGRSAEGQGWLTAQTQGGLIRVERREALRLHLPDGRPGDNADLKALVGSVDRYLYQAIFAFDTFALHEFANLEKDEIQERLFSAGVQGAGQNAAKILATLQEEQDSLWRPRSIKSIWGKASQEELELKTKLKEAEKRARDAQPLREQIRRLEEDQRTRAGTLRSLTMRLGQLDQAGHALPAWHQRQEALRRLTELPEPPNLPVTILAEARHLYTEIAKIEEELRRHETLPPPDPTGRRVDHPILEAADALGRCLEQRHAALADIQGLPTLSLTTRSAEQALALQMKEINLANPEDLEHVDSSSRRREAAARWVRDLPALRLEEKRMKEAAERELGDAEVALREQFRNLEKLQPDERIEAERAKIEDLWQRQRAIQDAQRQLPGLREAAEQAAEEHQAAQQAAGSGAEALEKLVLADGLVPDLRSWSDRFLEERTTWRTTQAGANEELERLQSKLSEKKKALGITDRCTLPADQSEAMLASRVARAGSIRQELEQLAEKDTLREPTLEELNRRLGSYATLHLSLDLQTADHLRRQAEELTRKEEDLRRLHTEEEASRQAAGGVVPPSSAEDLERREIALVRLRATLSDRNAIPRPQIPSWVLIIAALLAVVVAVLAGNLIGLILGILLALGLCALAWVARPRERARAEEAVAAAARTLDLPPDPSQLAVEELAAKLATARSELARELDARKQAEQRHTAARLASERLQTAQREHHTLRQRLEATTQSLGLPLTEATLLPPLLATLLERQRWLADKESVRQRRLQLHREEAAIHEQISAAEVAMGLSGNGDLSVRLERIIRRLAQARSHNQRQDQLEKEVREAEKELLQARARQSMSQTPPTSLQTLQESWQQHCLNLGLSGSPDDALRLVAAATRLQQHAKNRRETQALYLLLNTQISQFLEEEAALIERLGGGDLAGLWERLNAAAELRTRRRTMEEALPAREVRVTQAQRLVESARQKTEELAAREAQWRAWAQETGLPVAMEVEAARTWLDGVVQAREAANKVEDCRSQEGECQKRIAGWWERLEALARALELPAPARDDGGRGWLDDLKRRLEGAQEAARLVKQEEQQRQEWETQRQHLQATLSGENHYFQSVLNKLNCLTMEEVEENAKLLDQHTEQNRIRMESEAGLRQHLGDPWENSPVIPLLALSPEDREEQRATLEAEWTAVDAEKSQADTQLGALRQQLADAEGDQEIATLSLKIASEAEQRRQAERRYIQLRLASHLLKSTLDRFRKERQPEVLRRAGAWFSEATAGQYSGLEADESGKGMVVLGRSGSPWKAEELSKGTGGLLYLCLRLALAEDHARRSVPLPILLDEVLVHFDRERSVQAARVLNEVAKERQILLFSCHDTTGEILRDAEVPYHLLSLERYGGQAEPLQGLSQRREDPRLKREDMDRASSISERRVAAADGSLSGESNAEDHLRSWFEAQNGSWVARADAQAAVTVGGAEWNRLVLRWQEEGKLEKTGERRGTRYRWIGEGG